MNLIRTIGIKTIKIWGFQKALDKIFLFFKINEKQVI